MPSIKASASPNLRGWQPALSPPVEQAQKGSYTQLPEPIARSPFMHASMPLMASTNDNLRQFYSNDNLPQQRILPARPGGAVSTRT